MMAIKLIRFSPYYNTSKLDWFSIREIDIVYSAYYMAIHNEWFNVHRSVHELFGLKMKYSPTLITYIMYIVSKRAIMSSGDHMCPDRSYVETIVVHKDNPTPIMLTNHPTLLLRSN